jgi:hypothetical protein
MLTTRTKSALGFGLVFAAVLVPQASADIPTDLTIAYDPTISGFTGDVTSPNKHCLAGRMVTITRFEGETPTVIATATTDPAGHFSQPAPDAMAGTYETTVAPMKVKRAKKKGKKRPPPWNCGAGTTGMMQL